ncbi:MAG: hypothetical protein ACKVZ0_18490 [Gemmatimonadales bacterium]
MGHRPGNIVSRAVRLSALLAALVGCGGPRPGTGGPARAPSLEPLPPDGRIDSVLVLESGSAPPEDTVVVIAAGAGRTIVLRRGAPDNSLFARLTVPAGPTERRLTLAPRPGLYGLDVAGSWDPATPVELVVSYALHFVAPAGARTRYGSDLGFERALLVAQVHPDGRVAFLRTSRPGSDLVRALLPGPGRFVVAAPRR